MTKWIVLGLPLGDFLTLLLVIGTWALAGVTLKLATDTRGGNRAMIELQRKEISARMALSLQGSFDADRQFVPSMAHYVKLKKDGVFLRGGPAQVDELLDVYFHRMDQACALLKRGVLDREDLEEIVLMSPQVAWPVIEPYAKRLRAQEGYADLWTSIEWAAAQKTRGL